MRLDLSFWRVVLFVSFAESWLWGKDGGTWFLHVGTFTDGESTALSIVILSVSIHIGFCSKKGN